MRGRDTDAPLGVAHATTGADGAVPAAIAGGPGCPSFFDPWTPVGTPAPRVCPSASYIGTAYDRGTGGRRRVYRNCDAWRCQACGPRMLGQHMAHFRAVLRDRGVPILYLTLTLRPEDSRRLGYQERVAALRELFASRLVHEVERATGVRLRYLAQVDVSRGGDHHQVQALVETDVHPSRVVAMWVTAGGGLDHDVQVLNPPGTDPDDVADKVARVSGFVVGGGRWPGHGRLMCSRPIRYGSADAKAARAEHRDAVYGEQHEREVFVAADQPEYEPRASEPRRDRAPFQSASKPSLRLASPVSLPNGEYVLVTRYNPADGLVTLTAADAGSGEALFRGLNSPGLLRRMLEEYDAKRGPSDERAR